MHKVQMTRTVREKYNLKTHIGKFRLTNRNFPFTNRLCGIPILHYNPTDYQIGNIRIVMTQEIFLQYQYKPPKLVV
jgi:hypothetical protein